MVMIIIVSFSFTNKLYHIFFIFSNKNNWSGAADSNRHCTDFKSALSAVGVPPDASQSFLSVIRASFRLLQVSYFATNKQAYGIRTLYQRLHLPPFCLIELKPNNIRVALVSNEVDPFYSVRQLPQLIQEVKKLKKLFLFFFLNFCKYIIS